MNKNDFVPSSSAALSRRLQGPPRTIDRATMLAVVAKGQAQLVLAGLGLVFVVMLVPEMNRAGVMAQLLPAHDVDGVVDAVRTVQRSSKTRHWTEWEFTAHVDGRPDVVSRGSARTMVIEGQGVHVRVPDARPDLSLAWTDEHQPTLAFFWVTLAALFCGAAVAVAAAVQNLRDLQLLRDGVLTMGTLVERTSRQTRHGRMWTLVFRYTTARAGEQTTRLEVSERDLGRVVDEDAEPIVYDPHRPDRALLLDALPDRVRVDGDGNLTPIPLRRGLVRISPLFVAVVFVVVGIGMLRLFG